MRSQINGNVEFKEEVKTNVSIKSGLAVFPGLRSAKQIPQFKIIVNMKLESPNETWKKQFSDN